MRAVLLGFVLGLGFTTTGVAQTVDETIVERRFDGEELANIFVAWTAVEREFRPQARLEEFYVRYSASERSVTVWFFKPNTISRTVNGETVIRHDLLSYRAVIENGAVRILSE